MRLRRRRHRELSEIELNFRRDMERCAEIDADPSIPDDRKLWLKAIVMLGTTSHAHLIDGFKPERFYWWGRRG